MWSDIKNEIIDNKIFLPDFLKKHFRRKGFFTSYFVQSSDRDVSLLRKKNWKILNSVQSSIPKYDI